jgi:NADPH:quinone reductase-like Zn-dependent oxidoreductase
MLEVTMKAVQIRKYGDVDVLRYVDVDEPIVNDDDVLIRVVGSSVNPVDWKIRAGHMQDMVALPVPATLGWDVSGVVRAVGKSVSSKSPRPEAHM